MSLGAITPDLRAAMQKMFAAQPQNPLYGTPDPSQPAAGPQPQPAAASPSGPTPAPAPAVAPDSPSPAAPSDGAAMLYGPPAAKPPMSAQDFAAANPDATKPYLQPRPVRDIDTSSHPSLNRAMRSLFAGMAEYGRPGEGAEMVNRWHSQDVAQRQYDTNQPKMQAGALQQAYQNYLQQTNEQAGIEHTQAETGNLRANVPLLQHQQQFLDKVRTLKESGKYGSDDDLFKAMLPEAATVPGMTRQMIVDAINNSKTLGSKYTLSRDPQTQAPIELVDRQGNHYSQSNLPKDPEAQQMWNDAAKAASGKEQVEEGKEKRVAGYAADRQAQANINAQQEQGRKAAATSVQDINDAKEQQKQMTQLLSGKMSPSAQTAAMFKLIGMEQPTGSHRIMPAEIEGVEKLGGWSDRIKQAVLNWKEGDHFSPDLIPDVLQTARTLSNTKMRTANDNLESNARIYGYKAPGSDTKGRFDKPEDYADTSAAGNQGGTAKAAPQGATHIGVSSIDGKKYYLDAQGKKLGPAE